MQYEIDFIGVPDADSADAIAFRWIKDDGTVGIGIYDGGTTKYAEALCELLDTYYFEDSEEIDDKVIDFVICSHSDQDHCAGLQLIIENYNVQQLYLNIPWKYSKTLLQHAIYSQTTEESLVKNLKNKYPYVDALEKAAKKRNMAISSCFQDTVIHKYFCVLAPKKSEFINNIINSDKTNLLESKESIFYASQTDEFQYETWENEKLPDFNETSYENESSVILLGLDEEKSFLLTGDAGINDLTSALNFSVENKVTLRKHIYLYQLPHHGGGKNINPYVLNRLVGPIQPKNQFISKIGIASAGTKGHHPYKIALNAFTRRGVSVYVTRGSNLHYSNCNFSERNNYHSVQKEDIHKTVEKLV